MQAADFFVKIDGGLIPLTRADALKLIWRHTHADYKGVWADGKRRVSVLREGGTTAVELADLTDAEIRDRLPYCFKLEAARLLAKRAKARVLVL